VKNRFLDRLRSKKQSPLILAHRGASSMAPENTLEAAKLAWVQGADAWELDVQLSRDGIPVVLHDASLARTTDIARQFPRDRRGYDGFRVCDFNFAEIRTLDAGSWFLDDSAAQRSAADFGTLAQISPTQRSVYRSGRVRIPTLEEALCFTADLDWLVNVEIKSFPDGPPGLVETVLDVIKRTDTASRVLLSSFDHRDVARMGRATMTDLDLATLARGILVNQPLYKISEYLTRIVQADCLCTSAEVLGSYSLLYRQKRTASALKTDEVSDLKSRGVPILVYTINGSAPGGLAEHLAELGVDALFTDDPAGIKARLD
jgi:glycerophosphoryl diester phosphodiesterase